MSKNYEFHELCHSFIYLVSNHFIIPFKSFWAKSFMISIFSPLDRYHLCLKAEDEPCHMQCRIIEPYLMDICMI